MPLPISKDPVYKTMINSGEAIFPVSSILYQGKLWLAPEWLVNDAEGWQTPRRIICLAHLQFQDLRGKGFPTDFSVPGLIPTSVLADLFQGKSVPGWTTIDHPPIQIPETTLNSLDAHTMRDDLLDARSAVEWADAHIPVLQERFISWQRRGPYKFVMETDPDDARWELLTAYFRVPLDPLIFGDVGAIINATRTALDILMYSVLARHRPKPDGKTHFPITSEAAEFLRIVETMQKGEKGIASDEAAAIKDSRAYRGGDTSLFPLHQLDIKRKHIRLLVIEPAVKSSIITFLNGEAYANFRPMQDKTILYRIPAKRFRPSKGNTLLTAEIFLNEPTLLVTKEPAIDALRKFIIRVREIILSFQ